MKEGTARAARFRLGGRLALAALAAFLLAVPFLLLLLLVRASSPRLLRLDADVAAALHRLLLDNPALAESMEIVSSVSHPFVLRGVALIMTIVLWRRGRRRIAIWLAVTMAAAGLIGILLKLVVARARPSFPDPILVAGGYSFPSGHAVNSMVFAGCLVVLLYPATTRRARFWLWSAAVGCVLLVGFDRVALGVHYVSDVLAGWLVGVAIVLATVSAFAVWRREEGLRPASTERGLEPERPPAHSPE